MAMGNSLAVTAALLMFTLAGAGAGLAQAPAQADAEHETHHPGEEQAAPPAPGVPPVTPPAPAGTGGPAAGAAPGGPGPMPMMPMMQMMPMTGMMPTGQPGMMPGPAMPGMHRGGLGGAVWTTMGGFDRIEGQLAYVRAELGIADAQLPQWNAFAAAARMQSTRLRETTAQALHQAAQPASAPEQMERRAALLSAEVDAMRAMVAAAGPLYGALTPDQRRTADLLMAEHLRAMHPGRP